MSEDLTKISLMLPHVKTSVIYRLPLISLRVILHGLMNKTSCNMPSTTDV